MSTKPHRSRVLFVSLAAAVTIAGFWSVHAQQPVPGLAPEGLDVVLLVDVSKSMFTANRDFNNPAADLPNGSDPQRLRWNAVQLVLNLLSAEDQVLIVPFNDQAPAQFGGQWIPGGVWQQLVGMGDRRGDYREALRRIVENFIPPDVGWPPFPNIDIGGTAILQALTKGAELSGATNPRMQRRLVAVLLTDGCESDPELVRVLDNDANDVNLRAYLKPWIERAAGRMTPVYTIGLGTEESVKNKTLNIEYLRRIANLTGGHFTWIQKNDQIIDAFRDLIWQLKGCWIKGGPKPAGEFATEDTMRGITELGILAYSVPGRKLPDGRPDPRNTDPPRVIPKFQWAGADRLPRAPDERGGKLNPAGNRDGYLYWSFARRFDDEKSLFLEYSNVLLRLKTTCAPDTVTHYLYYAKRTASPLFEVIEPIDSQSYPRFQPLAVRMRLTDNEHFSADQFRLTVKVKPHTDAAAVRPEDEKELELRAEPGSRDFVGSFRLDSLPQGKQERDFFTLRLIAEGVAVRENALSEYRLELPPRTIAVDNSIVLEAVPPVVLTDKVSTRQITVRAMGRIEGEMAIKTSLIPRRDPNKTPVPDRSIQVKQVDPAENTEIIRLRDGHATIQIALDLERVAPAVVYDELNLVLTEAKAGGRLLLTIPIGLRIDLAELATAPPKLHLDAFNRSGPIIVQMPNGVARDPKTVRVALHAMGTDPPLRPEELWLEPARGVNDPAVGAPRAKAQALDVPVGSAFQVRFEPEKIRARQKRYLYEWTLSAPWANPSSGLLTLDYQPPRLVVLHDPTPVRTTLGGKRDIPIAVALKGNANERCRVIFRPGEEDHGRAVFTCKKGPQAGLKTSEVRLDLPRQASAPWVAAGSPGEAVVHLGLTIPADFAKIPVGEYHASGVLASAANDARESSPIELVVIVNALEIFERRKPTGEWVLRKDSIDFAVFTQQEKPLTLRVKTGLDDPLVAGKLHVDLLGRRPNNDGDWVYEYGKMPRETVQPAKDDANALDVTIHFPSVRNAALSKPYPFTAALRYDEYELQRDVEVKVKFASERE
jgi:hypothetical protein